MMRLKHSEEYYKSNFFKWRQRIGFGISDYACNLAFLLANTFLLFYYTNIVGLDAGVAGIMFIVTKLIDGFTDYLVGVWIDRTDTRMGRYRPWMLFGTPVLAVGMVLIFSVPISWSTGAQIAWTYLSYIIFSFGYTLVNIPLVPCVTALTSDLHERTNIMTVKQMFGKLGALTSSVFALPLIYYFSGGKDATGQFLATGYRMASAVLGLVVIVIYAICVFNIEEVNPPIPEEKRAKPKSSLHGIWADMGDILKNKYFIIIVLFFILYYIGYFCVYIAMQYYFTYIIGDVGSMPIALACITVIPIPVFVYAAYLVSKGVGKATLLNIGGAICIIAFGIMFFCKTPTMAILSAALYGLGSGFRSSLLFATLPDVFDYTEYKTGRSLAGMQMAFAGFGNKLGSALASALVSGLLVWGLYSAPTLDAILADGGAVADIASAHPDTVLAIKLAIAGVSIVVTILSMVLLAFYDLDKKAPSIREELKQRSERYFKSVMPNEVKTC